MTAPAPTVLVVDDEEPLRRGLVRMLTGAGYLCATAGSTAAGRRVLESQPVDLVLCDVNMPGENGFGLLRTVSENHPDVGVLMVTAVADVRAAGPSAQYGALGYILKPFEASEILINVATALTRQTRDRVVAEQQQLETVMRLASVAEWRDPDTGKHLRSMSELSAALADAAGLTRNQVDMVRVASLLHDIGKVAVPDAILLKPGPLTLEERTLMQAHAETGAAMLRGSSMEVLQTGGLIALTHHERWDGSGYPRGLARLEIPIEARIVSIADVYDALASKRPYKSAWEPDRIAATMLAGRGSQFDPELLDLFFDRVIA